MNSNLQKYAALAARLAIAAIFVHGGWGKLTASIHVYKNLAIAGGLLALTAFGPGSLALEARTRKSRRPSGPGLRTTTPASVQA